MADLKAQLEYSLASLEEERGALVAKLAAADEARAGAEKTAQEALQAARADADAAAQEGGALRGKLIGALELLERDALTSNIDLTSMVPQLPHAPPQKVHRVYTSRRTPEQPDPQFVLCDICNVWRLIPPGCICPGDGHWDCSLASWNGDDYPQRARTSRRLFTLCRLE
ncbi:MAG: hypothetical protein J3K34DRAFT_461124 [Monoraphidium minutum]|nr:MAG: hypothetical protein J3K34DRAFT_461124 [Monoraphidium minutum]